MNKLKKSLNFISIGIFLLAFFLNTNIVFDKNSVSNISLSRLVSLAAPGVEYPGGEQLYWEIITVTETFCVDCVYWDLGMFSGDYEYASDCEQWCFECEPYGDDCCDVMEELINYNNCEIVGSEC